MKEFKLVPDKRIGNVIYIVEGLSFEQDIIQHLFHNLLGYSVTQIRPKKADVVFRNPRDKFSKVTVITALHPQIVTLEKGDFEKYLDDIFHQLSKDGIDPYNARVYYIFDRDRKCNRPGKINKAFMKYQNALDNGEEANGLMLLSYPCAEAFLCDATCDDKPLSCGDEAKTYTSANCPLSSVGVNGIERSCNFAMKTIMHKMNIDFAVSLLDNFGGTNQRIFDIEETEFDATKYYITLSLISLSFIDLGLLEENN